MQEVYLDWADRTEDIKVVFVGRPYTVLSPVLNCGIPEIFANLGVNAFYQDMLTYEPQDVLPIKPLLQELHWEYASKILEATAVLAGPAVAPAPGSSGAGAPFGSAPNPPRCAQG